LCLKRKRTAEEEEREKEEATTTFAHAYLSWLFWLRLLEEFSD
jgi:hypothetical protein